MTNRYVIFFDYSNLTVQLWKLGVLRKEVGKGTKAGDGFELSLGFDISNYLRLAQNGSNSDAACSSSELNTFTFQAGEKVNGRPPNLVGILRPRSTSCS